MIEHWFFEKSTFNLNELRIKQSMIKNIRLLKNSYEI